MPKLPSSLWNIPQRFISITHQLGRSWRRDVIKMTPEQIRISLDGFARLYPGQFGVTYEETKLGSIVSAKIYSNPSASEKPKGRTRVLLVHGGGFAFGSMRTHRALATALAAKTGTEVWLPDYSLAPENPFPKALEELLECFVDLTKTDEPIWLMGDSAGANLAAAVLNMAIERGLTLPAGLILLSPWIDLRASSESNTMSQAEWSPFERLDMLEYATHYLQGHSPMDPLASPIMAPLDQWPPVYLEASRAEYLWSDSEALATQLKEQKVDFEFRIEKASLHGWQLFPDILPEAKRSIHHMATFLEKHSQLPAS